jgi:hypothetical protein
MFKTVVGAAILSAGVLAMVSTNSQAAVYSQALAPAALAGATDYVDLARVVRRGPLIVVRPYRAWVRRPHYGTIIAGVVLGTIIAAAVAGVVPPPPRPDLCWYWADRAHTRGYWDYC